MDELNKAMTILEAEEKIRRQIKIASGRIGDATLRAGNGQEMRGYAEESLLTNIMRIIQQLSPTEFIKGVSVSRDAVKMPPPNAQAKR